MQRCAVCRRSSACLCVYASPKFALQGPLTRRSSPGIASAGCGVRRRGTARGASGHPLGIGRLWLGFGRASVSLSPILPLEFRIGACESSRRPGRLAPMPAKFLADGPHTLPGLPETADPADAPNAGESRSGAHAPRAAARLPGRRLGHFPGVAGHDGVERLAASADPRHRTLLLQHRGPCDLRRPPDSVQSRPTLSVRGGCSDTGVGDSLVKTRPGRPKIALTSRV